MDKFIVEGNYCDGYKFLAMANGFIGTKAVDTLSKNMEILLAGVVQIID